MTRKLSEEEIILKIPFRINSKIIAVIPTYLVPEPKLKDKGLKWILSMTQIYATNVEQGNLNRQMKVGADGV